MAFVPCPSAAPLSELCPLVLRELVQHAIRQLALRGVVATVVESAYLAAILLELLAQQVVVGGLAGDTVSILGQHHGDSASSHEVPHTIHAWPLKACAALPGVYYLLEDL